MIDSMGVHCIPSFGIRNAHLRESGIGTVTGMRPRDVLAENLKKLMAVRADRARFPEITAASNGELTNGTLDRIRRAEVAITVDKLAALAAAFDLQPWQLLVENLNPKALPRLADSAFLSELQQIVHSVKPQNEEDSSSSTEEQALQRAERSQPVKVGPALQKAFDSGVDKNARRGAAPASKPKGRRRS